MKIGRSRAARRGMVMLTSLCLVVACTNCDRKEDGQTEAPAVTFEPPVVDVSMLTPALQKRVEEMRQASADSPRNPDNAGLLGSVYYVQGFPKEAVTCFEHAVSLAPQWAHWHYYLALAYERERDIESAQKAYERAMEIDPEYAPFKVKLAQLIVDKDPDRAATLCQSVLEADPGNAAAILTLGEISSKQGDNQKAIEYAEKALGIMPNYREAHATLASIYKQIGRDEDAERETAAARAGRTPVVDDPLFERLLRNGLSPEIIFYDIEMLVRRGALPQAEKALELGAVADRKGDATLKATGMLRTAQGRYDEAADAYRRLIASDPKPAQPHLALADVLAQAGRDDEAEREFATLLEREPDDAQALESYMRFLVSRDQGAKAEEIMRAAVERNGESAQLHFLLGGLLADLGRNDAAREQLEICLKLAPGQPAALWTLGLIAERAGDHDQALKQWQAALESAPDFAQAHVSLAQAAMSEKKYDLALQHLRAGFKATPDSAALANALAWLLATCPNDSVRDGEEAVKLAEAACLVTQNRTHAYLDTLAAAYAEKGRFDDAVRTVGKAIETAKAAGDDTAAYEARLKLYEQKKPYREAE